MPFKKISIFTITLIVLVGAIYKVSTPPLIRTSRNIQSLIIKTKTSSPCTDWQIEIDGNQPYFEVNESAIGIQIAAHKALIMHFWLAASNHSFEKIIEDRLNINSDWIEFIKNHPIKKITTQQKNLYYLQSIIYDIIANNISPSQFFELSNDEIKRLNMVANFLENKLMTLATRNAKKRRHSLIEIQDIQTAFNELITTYNFKKENHHSYNTQIYKLWLNHFSKQLVNVNRERLNNCNNFNRPDDLLNYLTSLNQIFEQPVYDFEFGLIISSLIKNTFQLYIPVDVIDLNTIIKPKVSLKDLNERSYTNEIYTFNNHYINLFKQFPFKINLDGSLEANYLTFKSKKDFINYKNPDKIIINQQTLNAVYKTGIQWQIIHMVNEYYRPAIMDPIALELLAKKIAQYIAITLQSNSNISKILNSNTKENIKKNQLLNKRFLQSTDLNKQIQTYKIKPKKYFKKTFEFNLTPPLSLGYFSGISLVDINQDNNLDMIVPNNNIINVVINDGIKNIKKIQLKTDNQGQFSAAYAIDINNDYWLDIIAINENGLNFFIQTAPETFKFTSLIPISNISSLCVNDIDNDLDNDIYVTRNFGKVAIDGNNAPPNKLIENIGNNTFKIKSMPNIESTKFSSGCSILDINNDTLNDIIVINEFGNNELFLQEIPNQFSNKSNRYGFNDSGGSINLNIVDFNHDEFWDIFISMVDIFNNQISLKGISNPSPIFDQIMNISPVKMGNKIYLGSANKLENNSQKIIKSGVMGWSWGSAFFDYDNDSDQDFYITNGNFDLNSQNNDKNIFMLNHKNTLNFSNSISAESHEQNSRAVSSGDFNNDGDIDLVIKNTNKIIQFKNINKSKYPWLKIKLNGPTPNTYAIGSIITLHTNKKTLKKIILPQTGFLSQSPYIQHFGIGDQTIQKITIAWPDKLVSTIKPPVPINELLIIQHPTLIKN